MEVAMKYKLNSFCIINTIHFISSNKRVWITSICIINISVVYIAIKSSTSLSSSSIIEVNSDVCVLPSRDSRATVKSSISSSSSSISHHLPFRMPSLSINPFLLLSWDVQGRTLGSHVYPSLLLVSCHDTVSNRVNKTSKINTQPLHMKKILENQTSTNSILECNEILG